MKSRVPQVEKQVENKLETSIEKSQFNKRSTQPVSVCYYRSVKMPKASKSAQHTVEPVLPEEFSDQEETSFEQEIEQEVEQESDP